MASAPQPRQKDSAIVLWATVLVLLFVLFIGGYILIFKQTRLAPLLVPLLALFALALRAQEKFRGFSFAAWVLTFLATAMNWPQTFGHWFGFDLRLLIVPLVQVIMFGMGTKLSARDFLRVMAMPRPVLVGVVLHFGVMPLAGYAIARMFGFPPEVAAGVILVGSVSSGVASNVIVYLARGDVALAVTITACSTLVSPFMTPILMKILASRLVPIDFVAMMIEVFSMVIVPVLAGLVAHGILYGSNRRLSKTGPLIAIAVLALVAAMGISSIPLRHFGPLIPLSHGVVLGFLLIGLVALTKWIVRIWSHGPEDWMDKALPIVSMAGICLIIGIIAARSRDRLLAVGPLLILAAVLHNAIGYLLGYWLARAVRLNESACRTIAVEVGMQNGGMATGLAISVLQSADAALAPAIFGTWMNISGSILASWWRRRPVPSQIIAPTVGPAQTLQPAIKRD
jgi:BASS family bile acid:Na+ symporter